MNAEGATNLQGLVLEWKKPDSPFHRPTRPLSWRETKKGDLEAPHRDGWVSGCMYQAGTNGTPECKSHLVIIMLLSLVFGRLMLMVPRLCCNVDFGQVVAFAVTSLLHFTSQDGPAGICSFIPIFLLTIHHVMSINACPVTLTNLKLCFIAFAMPSEKQ